MGRGDIRTKKGKITKSSFGKSRPKKARNKLTRHAVATPSKGGSTEEE